MSRRHTSVTLDEPQSVTLGDPQMGRPPREPVVTEQGAPERPPAGVNDGPLPGPSLLVVLGGLGLCAFVLLLLETYLGVYMPDDAYITYRYAENLASGAGLVFNSASPPVEGYSNLSWIVLLAGLAKLGLDIPVWAAELGRILSLINLVLVYLLSLGVMKHRGWALIAPALLALTAPYAQWARGGLETMWYTTLLLLGVWLVTVGMSGRFWAYPLAALSMLALALTRHDGAIPMGLAGVFVLLWSIGLWRAKPRNSQTIPGIAWGMGSFAALAAIYLAYTWWRGQYFGELVPAPVFSRLGATFSDPSQIARTLGSYFTRGSNYSAYGDLLVPVFAGVFACIIWFRKPSLRDWFVLACAGALSFLYFISESYNPAIRYMVPVLPLLYLYAQAPLAALIEKAWKAGTARGLSGTWAAASGVVLAVATFMLVMAPRTQYDTQRAEQAKLRALVPIGQWLHNVAPPGAAVALQDIGVVAYYSGLKVIDNNPGALTNGDLIYRKGKEGFADLSLDPQPEFMVFTSGSYINPSFYLEFEALRSDPRFLNNYKVYGQVKYWADRCYWIYVRNDVYASLGDPTQTNFPHSDW